MKIGYVRLSQEIEFSYKIATQPGIEERQGMMKALCRAGNELVIFSKIKKDHQALLKSLPKGLKWLKKVKFDYTGYPADHKCKFLIVEMGPDNMMYGHKPTDEPYIRRMCRVVDGHKGVVMYYHSDPLVPFPMDQIVGRKYPWGHKKNGWCNEKHKRKGWGIRSCWGTHDEMFNDKTFIILHRADNVEAYLDNYDSGRMCYRKYPINLEYLPIAVDFSFRKHLEVRKEPKRLIVYPGGDRCRRNSFKRIYGGLAERGIPVHVTGKWPDNFIERYPLIKSHGWKKYFWQIDRFMNNTRCTIQILPDKACRMDWATLRPLEAIAEGVIALYDVKTKSSSLPLSKDFAVADAEDAYRKVKKIKKMSYKERKKINDIQMSRIRRLTFGAQVQALLRIYEKYS